MLNAIALELMGICSTEDFVAGDLGSNYLTDNITIGEAYNKAVFRCVVFVLRLGDETLSGVVVGLAGPTTLIFGLIATIIASAGPEASCLQVYRSPVVRTILDQLSERLSCSFESAIDASDFFRSNLQRLFSWTPSSKQDVRMEMGIIETYHLDMVEGLSLSVFVGEVGSENKNIAKSIVGELFA